MINTIRHYLLFTFATLQILSCGEPLGPAPFGWEKKADIPPTYFDLSLYAVGPRGVYGVAWPYEGSQQLVVFDGSEFLVDYEVPSEEDYISGVAFIGGSGFMGVMLRTYPKGARATLMQLRNGVWEEVLRAPEYQGFSDIQPIDKNTCWLSGKRPAAPYAILKYENGALQTFGATDSALTAYSSQTTTYYVLKPEKGVLLITSDGGATWHEEVVEVPAHYELKRILHIAASPDALYLTTRVVAAGLEYYAIVKRTGLSGDGVYEFSYIGWSGPGVGQIDWCAFRDVDHGMAVGLGTSMYYDAPNWFREPADPFDNFFTLVPDPRGGYWAINGSDLVWHP